jgi:uncharacterized membrane protein YhaH (DUF805 family)
VRLLLWLFFSRSGRIGREAFWLAQIFLVFVSVAVRRTVEADALAELDGREVGYGDIEAAFAKASLAATLATAWPRYAVIAKRLRDIGYGEGWLAAALAAMVLISFSNHPLGASLFYASLLWLGLAPGMPARAGR